MAELTTHIPDELDARVRSHINARGEDLASFTARAFDEQLALDADPILQAELVRQTRQAKQEIDSGHGIDARQAMRAIATSKGLNFDR